MADPPRLAEQQPPSASRRAIGAALALSGVLLAVLVVVFGKPLLPGLAGPEAIPLEQLRTTPTWARLPIFAYGFPLGLALVIAGAALLGGARGRRLALLAAGAAAGPVLMILVPRLFGSRPSPAYFGIGGVAILALFVAVVAAWARLRATLDEPARGGADLQALGYLSFALAAWNICGASSMPGWALYPERVIAGGTQVFVVSQLKAAMAFFVVGWLCTLLGLHRAARRRAPAAPQRT